MTSYDGKRMWIIGASTGIGRALAVELSKRGATLCLSARDNQALIDLNALLGSRHTIHPLDVTDAKAFADTAKNITSARLDSVIFMAGQYKPMRLDALDLDECSAIVDTNLKGALNMVAAVLPPLLAQKSGQIAVCGSIAGYRGLPNGQPYGATKAALINLTESLRAENMRKGIDVRLISPGFVKTRLTEKNTFKMPTIIEPEQAARAIADGLSGRAYEIDFPKRLTILVKLLRLLPAWLYFRIVRL